MKTNQTGLQIQEKLPFIAPSRPLGLPATARLSIRAGNTGGRTESGFQ